MDSQFYRFFAWFFGLLFWVMFAFAWLAADQRDELRSNALTGAIGDGSRVTLECVQVGRSGAK